MPRQIIDTESSRPQYVRRVAFRIAASLAGLAVLIFLAIEVLEHAHH